MALSKTEVKPKIVLSDPSLFGNDAAEDEADEIFYSYVVERPELEAFTDPTRKLCIVHAYKGEGKSALLRLAAHRVGEGEHIVNVARKADDLAPDLAGDDHGAWVRAWKANIVTALAVEIGATIGIAWSDDAMSLVEESEKRGWRRRSILSSILDRLKLSETSVGDVKVSLPERKVLGAVNPEATVRRWVKGGPQLWLFVDDVDKNFANTGWWKHRVSAFFDACRSLNQAIPELRIRAIVRPNVWTILKREFESLSHVEQYLVNLTWSLEDARHLLAKRIEGYLRRTDQWDSLSRTLRGTPQFREETLLALVFESPMQWGGQARQPHYVLYTLSKWRPRWIIELCRTAAAAAVRARRAVITLSDIVDQLTAFGRRRIDDTVSEFRSLCSTIDELIMAFSGQKEELTTQELLKIVDDRIMTHVDVTIAGVSGRVSAMDVASLLFEIELYYGRRDFPDQSYEHVNFTDSPTLLRSRTNIDTGLIWEIHPVFRQALEMRDREGRERRTARRRNR